MKKSRAIGIIVFCIMLLAGAEAFPAVKDSGYNGSIQKIRQGNKIVAAQILLFYAKTPGQLKNEIARMKLAGVNTLIVRVFQNRGDRPYPLTGLKRSKPGVYFNTAHAPVIYDLLGKVVAIAKPMGMKVFAWMTTRTCDWLPAAEDRGYEYDFSKKRIVRGNGLNIFSAFTADYLSALYKDLAYYDIDGILFQDDLVLRHNEGFSPVARMKYKNAYGHEPHPSNLYKNVYYSAAAHKYYVRKYTAEFRQWAKFKNDGIMHLTSKIMDSVHSVNPGIKFALNCYYEAALMPDKALLWLAQDLNNSKNYGFDYYSMMSYHDQIKKELDLTDEQSINKVKTIAANLLRIVGDPNKILMKVQIVDWDNGRMLKEANLDKVMAGIESVSRFNIALVPYRNNSVFFDMANKLGSDLDNRRLDRQRKGLN